MTRIFIALLALLGSALAAEGREPLDWAWYKNPRHGFQLSYPSSLFTLERRSRGGDGELFVSPDGEARLLVGVVPNADGHDLGSYQELVARRSYNGFRITYQRRGGGWFVLSVLDGERIFYEKVFLGCQGRVFTSFALVYPTRSRALYDPIVERIEQTFAPGRRSCVIENVEASPPPGPRPSRGVQD